MGLPVTVYRSTDAGAPQLSPVSPSSVITILKKCLVEGYGSKAALGWSIAFEDAANFAIAFRNSTVDGSGGYVKVYSATGADTVSTDFRVNVAQSMTDINTLINPSGLMTYDLNASYQGAAGWQLIGTSRSFFLIINSNYHGSPPTYNITSSTGQIYQNNIFVGDIEALDANDLGQFILLHGNASVADYTSTTYSTPIGGNFPIYATCYPVDGSSATKTLYRCDLLWGATTTKYSTDAESLGVGHSLTPSVLRFSGNIYQATIPTPACRGTIPGLFQSHINGYSTKQVPYDLDIAGVNHTLLSCFNTSTLWVNMEEWYV